MSGLNSGNRKDYSKYDKMSTESLEELLRLDAELPDGEGSDIDEILYISEVIAKRDREQPTGRYSEADVDAASFKLFYIMTQTMQSTRNGKRAMKVSLKWNMVAVYFM